MAKPDYRQASGLRPPLDPPDDADALGVVLHYLREYERDFARARLVVKGRASLVVVWSAIATGLIAVVGAATSVLGLSWLGIASAVLAGLLGVLSAWDGLFRHRDLWHQRSVILGQLQALKRQLQVELAAGRDRNELAREGLQVLDRVLTEDITTWVDVRKRSHSKTADGVG